MSPDRFCDTSGELPHVGLPPAGTQARIALTQRLPGGLPGGLDCTRPLVTPSRLPSPPDSAHRQDAESGYVG